MNAPETIVFLCPACTYKARIPSVYANTVIVCPGCRSSQQAIPLAAMPSTGKTVTVMRLTSGAPPAGRTPPSGKTPPAGAVRGVKVPSSPEIPAEAPAGTATIEFSCPTCAVRVRIPSHYLGKSILCPRCSTPQRVVDASGPMRPMDTTRALRSARDGTVPEVEPRAFEPRARPDTTDIVPQQATVLPGQALEPEPGTAHPATDSALTRSGLDRQREDAELAERLATPPARRADQGKAAGEGSPASPRRAAGVARSAVPPPAPVLPPPPAPRPPVVAIALGAVAVVLAVILALVVVAWRQAATRAQAFEDQVRELRQEREQAQVDRRRTEERLLELERASAAATAAPAAR